MKSYALALLAGLVAIALFVAIVYATGHRITAAAPTAPCLAAVQAWTPAKRIWALRLAERALAEGGSGPAPGSCEAERLEWLREVAR